MIKIRRFLPVFLLFVLGAFAPRFDAHAAYTCTLTYTSCATGYGYSSGSCTACSTCASSQSCSGGGIHTGTKAYSSLTSGGTNACACNYSATCSATKCSTNYYLSGSSCKACESASSKCTSTSEGCTPSNGVTNAASTSCSAGTRTRTASSYTSSDGNSSSGCTCNYSAWGSCSTSCVAATCNASYYLSSGACPQCGGADYYCPQGNSGRSTVLSGYYSTGGSDANTRTGQSQCEKGNKCVSGVKTACSIASDEYQPSAGQTTCLTCTACSAGTGATCTRTLTTTACSYSDGCTASTDSAAWYKLTNGTAYNPSCTACNNKPAAAKYTGNAPASSSSTCPWTLTCAAGTYFKYNATETSRACVDCVSGEYCPGVTVDRTTSGDAGKYLCSGLTGVSPSEGTYSSVSPYSASTNCRYLAPTKTMTGCTSVQTNSVSYGGSSWPATTYTITANKGYVIANNGASTAICNVCSGTNAYTAADGNTLTSCTSCPTGYATPDDSTAANHDEKADCKINCSAGQAVLTADAQCATIGTSTYKGYWVAAHTVKATNTTPQGSTAGATTAGTINLCPTGYQCVNGTTQQASCTACCLAGQTVPSAKAVCADLSNVSKWMAAHNVTYGNTSTANSCLAAESGWTLTAGDAYKDETYCRECQSVTSNANCAAGLLCKQAASTTAWGSVVQIQDPIVAKPGSYVDLAGRTCIQCGAGTFTVGNNSQSACTQCAVGSYNNAAGQTACTACGSAADTKGKTTSAAGKTSCDANCGNAANVSSWVTASWASTNSVSNLCAIAGCIAGYGDGGNLRIPKSGSDSLSATDAQKLNTCPIETYAIAYHLNGGTHGATHPATYQVTTATISISNPAKTGYTFGGWCDDQILTSNCSTSKQIALGSTGAKTFYAKWTANTYTLAFNGNSNTGGTAPSSITCTYDQDCPAGASVLPGRNTLYRNGHAFARWCTGSGGTGTCSTTTVKNLTADAGGSVDMHAIWTICPAAYYADSTTNGACALCADGYYSTGTGNVSCTQCGQNNYCKNGVKNTCPNLSGTGPYGAYALTGKTITNVSTYKTDCFVEDIPCTDSGASPNIDGYRDYCYYNTARGGYCGADPTAGTSKSANSSYSNEWEKCTIDVCHDVTQHLYLSACTSNTQACASSIEAGLKPFHDSSTSITVSGNATYTNAAWDLTNCSAVQPHSGTNVRGSGTKDCKYTSGIGTNAVFSTTCTYAITKCDAGYYLAGPGDAACTETGGKHYSAADATARTACPAAYQDATSTTLAGQTNCQVKCLKGTQVAAQNAACTTPGSSFYAYDHYVNYGSTSGTNVNACMTNFATLTTTAAADHDNYDDCKRACAAGTYTTAATGACVSVETGYWSAQQQTAQTGDSAAPLIGRTQCPENYRAGAATTAQNLCKASCAAGAQVAAPLATCTTPAGSWYAFAHTVEYGQVSGPEVKACMTNFATPGTTAAADHSSYAKCSRSCAAGTYTSANTANCSTVGTGYWSPDQTAAQTAADAAPTINRTQCPENYRAGAATTAQNLCRAACAAGQRVAVANAACSTPAGSWYGAAHNVNYGDTSPYSTCIQFYATANTTTAADHDAFADCKQTCQPGYWIESDVKDDPKSACLAVGLGYVRAGAATVSQSSAAAGTILARLACDELGGYSDVTTGAACKFIEAGYYKGSNEEMIRCPVGEYCPNDGKKYTCAAGYYCPAGSEDKYGKISSGQNAAASHKCAVGYYCPAGSEDEHGKMSQCAGRSDEAVCNTLKADQHQCRAGFYCPVASENDEGKVTTGTAAENSDQHRCAAGYWCPIGSETGVGKISVGANKADERKCKAGYYCPIRSEDQYGLISGTNHPCPAGYYCPSNSGASDTLAECPAGRWCEGGAPGTSTASPGTPGTATIAGDGLCLDGYYCPTGSFTNKGHTAASQNSSGLTVLSATDKVCEPGYYCPAGSEDKYGKIANCANRSDTAECEAIKAAAHKCAAGYYCPAGSENYHGKIANYTVAAAAEHICRAGWYCPIGSETELGKSGAILERQCAAGWYCPAQSETEKGLTGAATHPCPAGYYCPANSTEANTLAECPPGKWCAGGTQSTPGSTSAAGDGLCLAGYYCMIGSLNNKGHRAASQNADALTFADATDHVCLAGYYCPAGSETEKGKIAVHDISRAAEHLCGAGYYCPAGSENERGLIANHAVARAAQHDCKAGYYCPTGSETDVGKIANHTVDRAVMHECKTGWHCPLNSETMFGEVAGIKHPCPKGYYCPARSAEADTLAVCPAGYYCPLGSENAEGRISDCAGRPDADACDASKANVHRCAAGYYCMIRSYTDYGHRGESTHAEASEPDDSLCGGKAANLCAVDHLCKAGWYCPAGSETMFGQISAGEDMAAEHVCEAGWHCPMRSEDQYGLISGTNHPCPAGYYCPSNSGASDTLAECPAGRWCEGGAPGTSTANNGSAGTPSRTGDGNCLPGYYCLIGSYDEKGKRAASHITAEDKADHICAAGFYCPEGSEDRFGLISDCAGRMNASLCIADQAAVHLCRAGYYCPAGSEDDHGLVANYNVARAMWHDCKAGWYCPIGSETETGKIDNHTVDRAAQHVCEAGWHCPLNSETRHGLVGNLTHPCPDGYYCPANSGEDYSLDWCPAGMWCKGGAPGTALNSGKPGVSAAVAGETDSSGKYISQKCGIDENGMTLIDKNGNAAGGYYCLIRSFNARGHRAAKPEFQALPNYELDDPACVAGRYCQKDFAVCNHGERCEKDHLCRAGWYCPVGSEDYHGWIGGSTIDATDHICPIGSYCLEGMGINILCPLHNKCQIVEREDVLCAAGFYRNGTPGRWTCDFARIDEDTGLPVVEACTVGQFGHGTIDAANGTCLLDSCDGENHVSPDGLRCDPNVIDCDVANGRGYMEWSASTKKYVGCIAHSCDAGYELDGGACAACGIPNVLSYEAGADCEIKMCRPGYHKSGDACLSDIDGACAVDHGSGTRSWNPEANDWGACGVSDCEEGYHIEHGACEVNEQECEVENGRGIKEWTGTATAGRWGECEATMCYPGWTMDRALTNEWTRQCGRCGNYFGYDGEPAVQVGGYKEECDIDIGACMYLNEKYVWQDGECIPICEDREDETGRMRWNGGSNKCEFKCEASFDPWEGRTQSTAEW